MEGDSLAEVVAACQQSDRAAQRQFYDAFHQRVFAWRREWLERGTQQSSPRSRTVVVRRTRRGTADTRGTVGSRLNRARRE